jgi:pyruvate/2-oxoglutarate dehydrogenase complex dihydrolipoamide acyltransferase (E2) component
LADTRPYHVVELTPGRRVWIQMLDMCASRHPMYGLLEVDVTVARQIIAAHRARTGEALSFTGFLTYCLAQAVDEDKTVQALPKGRQHLVVFDDVDVAMMIEGQSGGKTALLGHVIRGANRKTVRQIHDEIRAVQSQPAPPDRGVPGWFRSGLLLPWPLCRWFQALIRLAVRRDPALLTAMGGTVGISAVGMFAKAAIGPGEAHSAWGLYPPTAPLELVVGTVSHRPAVVEGRIEPREMLNLTVVFDHDVIDGAPAARFTRRLVELIESGAGLDALAVDPPEGRGAALDAALSSSGLPVPPAPSGLPVPPARSGKPPV